MDKIISCEFNIDTACVEVKYADEIMISIDCTRVEYEVARNMYEASKLDWLVYNAPVDYVNLLLHGDIREYLRNTTDFLYRFRVLDMSKEKHRRMLIDMFINRIYLYDDKLVITFNHKDGAETITLEDIETALAEAGYGSDLVSFAVPYRVFITDLTVVDTRFSLVSWIAPSQSDARYGIGQSCSRHIPVELELPHAVKFLHQVPKLGTCPFSYHNHRHLLLHKYQGIAFEKCAFFKIFLRFCPLPITRQKKYKKFLPVHIY